MRVGRIELPSRAWKACILATVLHPQVKLPPYCSIFVAYNKDMRLFRSRHTKPSSAVIHSNGFADAADKGNPTFGSTSPETFNQRRAVDHTRRHVNRFQDARVHYDYRTQRLRNQPDLRKLEKPVAEGTAPLAPVPDRSVPRTSAGFREPSSRGFNPFR